MNGTMVQNLSNHFATQSSPAYHRSSPNNRQISIDTEAEVRQSMQPPSETHVNGKKIGLSVQSWLISEIDRRRYGAVFRKIAGTAGKKVSGTQVRDYFVRFQLPKHVLRDIWEVADEKHQGELDEEHFSIALHLLERVLRYSSATLPSTAMPAIKTHHPLSSGPTYKPPQQMQHVYGMHALGQQQNLAVMGKLPLLPPNRVMLPVYPPLQSAAAVQQSILPAALVADSHATTPKSFTVSPKVDQKLNSAPSRSCAHLRAGSNTAASVLGSGAVITPEPSRTAETSPAMLQPAAYAKKPSPATDAGAATLSSNLSPKTTRPLSRSTTVQIHSSNVTSSPVRVCSVIDAVAPTAVAHKRTPSHGSAVSTGDSVAVGVEKAPATPLPAENTAEYERLLKQLDAKRKIRHGLSKRVDKMTQKLSSLSALGSAEQQAVDLEVARCRSLVDQSRQTCENLQLTMRTTAAEMERLKTQRTLLANRKLQLVGEKSGALQEIQMLHTLQRTSGPSSTQQHPDYEPILQYKRQQIDLLRQQVAHAERLIQQRRAEVLQVEYNSTTLQTAMKADRQHNEVLLAVYAGKQMQLRENLSARRRKFMQLQQERMRAAQEAQAERERQILLWEEQRRYEQMQKAHAQQQQQLKATAALQKQQQQTVTSHSAPRSDIDLFSVTKTEKSPVPVGKPTLPTNTVPSASVVYDQFPTRAHPPVPSPPPESTRLFRGTTETSGFSQNAVSAQPPQFSPPQHQLMPTTNIPSSPTSLLFSSDSANSSIRSASSVSSRTNITPDRTTTATATAAVPTKSDAVPLIVRPAPPPPSLAVAGTAVDSVLPFTDRNSLYTNVGVESAADSVYDVPKPLATTQPMYSNIGQDHYYSSQSKTNSTPTPSHALPTTPGLLFVAVQNYRAVADDELALRVGDLVQVMVLHQDKWWYGKLVEENSDDSVSSAGYFPASAVQRMADVPVEYTALYDFEARNEDELSFLAGERLAIITASNASTSLWALARPVGGGEQHVRAGLVPINYLSPASTMTSMSPQMDDESIVPTAGTAVENMTEWDREFDDEFEENEPTYDFPASQQTPVLDAEQLQQRKNRSLAVDELTTTEKTYNTFLHAVIDRFDELFGDFFAATNTASPRKASSPQRNALPTQQQRRSMSVSHSSSNLLNNDEFDLLCGGWADLAHCSDMLLLNWNQQQHSTSVNMLTNAFIQLLPEMQNVYAEFCSRQIRAITLIRTKCQQSEAFDAAVKQFSAGSTGRTADGLRGCTLEAAFVRPLERITRYPLLIKRILSLTTPNSDAADDFTSLTRALSAAEAACARINEGVGERESTARLEWLNQHVLLRTVICRGERLEDFSCPTNSMGQRQLLFFGTLFKSRSGKELVAFLFNDFLLLTTPSEALSSSAGQFSFDSGVWRQQQLKPYKTPIMLDRMRVRAAAAATDVAETTIYEVDESSPYDRGVSKAHKSNSLSRKSSMRRKLSFDHATSLRGNASHSDLGHGAEVSGSARDIFSASNSSEHLSSTEFIVQSSDGLMVRLKALSGNECRNWVKALRQAAAKFSRRANDMLACRAPVAPPTARQQRIVGRCRMQVVAAYGLKAASLALGAATKSKCVCIASIGAHCHTSPAADCGASGGGAGGGICRWNDTFSLPFSQRELDDADEDGKIVFTVYHCCIFRPDRLLGGCALRVRALVEQCEAKRGPVTLRVPLNAADIRNEGGSDVAEIEIKADVRLLSSESQVMLSSECLPIDSLPVAEQQPRNLFNTDNGTRRGYREKTKRSYVKLEASPHSRF